MTDIQIATTDGTSKILEEATVRAFRAGFRGPLLSPGDGAYDETRKVWNGMIDRRPALIARCSGVADVVAAVSFARAHGLLVSVVRRGTCALASVWRPKRIWRGAAAQSDRAAHGRAYGVKVRRMSALSR
jgi:hypothetical protein